MLNPRELQKSGRYSCVMEYQELFSFLTAVTLSSFITVLGIKIISFAKSKIAELDVKMSVTVTDDRGDLMQ